MKKLMFFTLVILIAFSTLACSNSQYINQVESDNINIGDGYQSNDVQIIEDDNGNSDDIFTNFLPPAYTTDIDFSSDDPSNDEISFEYDNQGRITTCYYEIDGTNVYQSYTYSETLIEIYTFCDSTVIGEATFEYVSDDENFGFIEQDGYYFKGVSFEPLNDTAEYFDMITEEEAVVLVRDRVGEGYGLLPEGLVERNGEQYYSIRVTYLVDEYHSSTLTQYLVKADGSEIVDYFE